VRIQGIVRPVDIQPDNTVPSTKVADASISYGGQGALADANAKGWLSRFFDSPLTPF
jgi:flagellar L-ring protein precursor FlgH